MLPHVAWRANQLLVENHWARLCVNSSWTRRDQHCPPLNFWSPLVSLGSALLSVTGDLTETHLLCHKGNEEQTLLTKESKSIFMIKAGLYSSGNKLQIVTLGNCSLLLQLSWRHCKHLILYPLAHVLWEMVIASSSQNKQTNKWIWGNFKSYSLSRSENAFSLVVVYWLRI